MNLNQVTLPCTDFDASVQFYKQLGFKQIVSSPPRYARFECESGATFSLHLTQNTKSTSGVVIYFEVQELDATVAKLQGLASYLKQQQKIRVGCGARHIFETQPTTCSAYILQVTIAGIHRGGSDNVLAQQGAAPDCPASASLRQAIR